MADKAPAFQFYPKDYLSDAKVRGMTYEERGMYWELVSHCWMEGTIPSDVKHLARLLGVRVSKFQKCWPQIRACFRIVEGNEGVLDHARLAIERRKQQEWSEKSRRGGKHSPTKGQANGNHPLANEEPPPQANGNSPVSSLQSPSPVPAPKGAGGEPPPPPKLVTRQNPRIVNPGGVVQCWDFTFTDLMVLAAPKWPEEGERRKALWAWMDRVDDSLRTSGTVPNEEGRAFWLKRFRSDFGADATPAVVQGVGKTSGNAAALKAFVARGHA